MEEEGWVKAQRMTFTSWVNLHLNKKDLQIQDLKTDLCDGVLLCNLVEIISGKKIPDVVQKPKFKLHKVQNLNGAIHLITEEGVKLVGCGAEDIHDGNLKLIMGLIWSLINKYQIQLALKDKSSSGDNNSSGSNSLLNWVNEHISKDYKGDKITNFHTNWKDGLAFCALTEAALLVSGKPNVINVATLDKSDPVRNMTLAFDAAQKHLGLPKMMDPLHIHQADRPDDKSVMTYVSLFVPFFAPKDTTADTTTPPTTPKDAQTTATPASPPQPSPRAPAPTPPPEPAKPVEKVDDDELRRLRAELKLKTEELLNVKEKLNDLEVDCTVLTKDKKELQDELDNLKKQLKSRDDDILNLKSQHEQTERDLARQREEAEDLKRQLEALRKETESAYVSLQECTTARQQQSENEKKQQGLIEQLQRELAQLETLHSGANATEAELLTLKKEKEELAQQNDKLKEELDKLQQVLSDINNKQHAASTQAQRDAQNTQQQLQQLRNENEKLSEELEKERKNLLLQVETSNQDKSTLLDQIADLKRDKADLLKQYEELQAQSIVNSQDSEDAFKQQLAALQQQLKQLKQDLTDEQKKAFEFEKKNVVLSEQLKSEAAQCTRDKNELDEGKKKLADEIEKLNELLRSSRQSEQEYQVENDVLKKENEKLKQAQAMAQQQKDVSEEEEIIVSGLENKLTNLSTLQTQHKQLLSTIQNLRKKVSIAKKDISFQVEGIKQDLDRWDKDAQQHMLRIDQLVFEIEQLKTNLIKANSTNRDIVDTANVFIEKLHFLKFETQKERDSIPDLLTQLTQRPKTASPVPVKKARAPLYTPPAVTAKRRTPATPLSDPIKKPLSRLSTGSSLSPLVPKRIANIANQGTKLEEGEGQVDEMLADLIRKLGIDSSIVKKLNNQGMYIIGSKRVNLKILSGHLVIRVGGGFMKFIDWVAKFGGKEGIIINETPLEGVGVHVRTAEGVTVSSMANNNSNNNNNKASSSSVAKKPTTQPRKTSTTRVTIQKKAATAGAQQQDKNSNTL